MYSRGQDEFSFAENLLCDMMAAKSNLGLDNPARVMAILGHVFLTIGMITFFYIIPRVFDFKNRNVKLAQVFGMMSMTVFVLFSTELHDFFVLITGCLGIAALVPLAIEYIRLGWEPHSLYGTLCIILSLMVFFSFQFKILIDYLPVFQKTVFLLDSIWVAWVCLIVRKRFKLSLV